MKKIIFLTVVLAVLAASIFSAKRNRPIVQPADYASYMDKQIIEQEQESIDGAIDFWRNKLLTAPGNFVYEKKLAGLYSRKFKVTADPNNIRQSDSLLQEVNQKVPGQVGVLQSLAANAITRHAFKASEAYLKEAYEIGEKRFATSLMLTDVWLERGDLSSADRVLREVASESHFDYLIRDVKFQDQIGRLDKAIEQMENALSKAIAGGDKNIINWSLSNLADMYGHDGRIEQSYATYLKALSYKPVDLHSLKGIAWIAFSYDKNTIAAKKILQYLKSVHAAPDYDLLLADIARFEKNPELADGLEQAFLKMASQPIYGNMYMRYICDLRSDEPLAMAIAKREIEERPHPMSYDLLAWSSFQNGLIQESCRLVKDQVLEQTTEPVALYHAGVILKEAGQYKKAKPLLEEALKAAFELGPIITSEINIHLLELDRRRLAEYEPGTLYEMRSFR